MSSVHSIRDLEVLSGLKTSTLVISPRNNSNEAVSEKREQENGNRFYFWKQAIAFGSGEMKWGIRSLLLALLLLSFTAAGMPWV